MSPTFPGRKQVLSKFEAMEFRERQTRGLFGSRPIENETAMTQLVTS